MVTMILFLSVYSGQSEFSYTSDYGEILGSQTNEAPVKYAVKRLAKDGNKLDRIIAVTTNKAKETALDMFTLSVNSVSPETEIIPVNIKDTEDTASLLEKTLDKLLPLGENEAVIIETTGGFRNASNFLSLISRFLYANGTKILFSTYADFYSEPKCVKDTSETDELHDLLEAVNVFAATSNPELLISKVTLRQIPNARTLISSLNNYYEMVLCCKIGQYEKIIEDLRNEINELLNAEYTAYDISGILFRDVIRQILKKKTPFIFETDNTESLKLFITWCLDNNYIAQALIILMQKFIHEHNVGHKDVFERIRIYRNDISHADWTEEVASYTITEDEIEKIRKNATVNKIKKDVEEALLLV